MKVDIISGFLGAGKTTLIKKLLDTLVKDEKVAIVENEYGEVGIDGDLLKDRRIEVKEINSGCICCTIKGDYKQNILDIISNYRPDRIIIEPSGVANFSQVLESIKEAHIEGLRINMKITMVDAQNVHMYMKNFGDFYRSQLVNANTIILTRVEKLSDKEITHVCNEIKTINNIGFNLLILFVKLFSEKYVIFLAVVSLIMLFNFFKFAIDNSSDYRYSIFIFITFGLLSLTFNGIRQSLACSIWLLGFKYLSQDKGFIKYCLFTF